MSKIIDAEDYLERVEYEAEGMPAQFAEHFVLYTNWILEKTPPVNVPKEIIYCKDCDRRHSGGFCEWSGWQVYDNDYCSRGRRRRDE